MCPLTLLTINQRAIKIRTEVIRTEMTIPCVHKACYGTSYNAVLLPVQDLTTFYRVVFNYLQFPKTFLIFSMKRLVKHYVCDLQQLSNS